MRRGLAGSREQARRLIASGAVLVGGAPTTKAARLVSRAEPIEMVGPPPRFVSRGGDKLDAALDRFAVAATGKHALDAGASTGGFTDCLLQRGAEAVTCVDVGHGQLDARLRTDPRVIVMERTNVRTLTAGDVPGAPFSLVVVDLSFISLRTVAGVLASELASAGADVVALVKPQFEAGRAEASRGRGVVRDPSVWLEALRGVRTAFEGQGAAMIDAMVSPLTGAEGNVEFLIHLRAQSAGVAEAPDLVALVEQAARGQR